MQPVRSRYANWVRELATLIDAGLPLQGAVSKLTGHFAEDEVERFYDSLTEWLPRFFYVLVVGLGFLVLM